MNLASGMMAIAARKNSGVAESPSFDPAIVIGVKARRRRKNICMRKVYFCHRWPKSLRPVRLIPEGLNKCESKG